MNRKVFVSMLILVLVVATASWAGVGPLATSNCSDDLSWMGVLGPYSPNETPCNTWSHSATIATWDFQAIEYNGGFAWHGPDPEVMAHAYLQVGDASHQFVVSDHLSIGYFHTGGWAFESRRDGVRVEISPDGGLTWTEATALNVALSPAYTNVMTGGPFYGLYAYTGSNFNPTSIQMDFRGSTLIGQSIIIRLHLASDTSVGGSQYGIWVVGFNYYDAVLESPMDTGVYADNSSIYIYCNPGEDPRKDHTEVSIDAGATWTTTPTFPVQINNLTNDTLLTVKVRNVDLYENSAESSAFYMKPLCTEAPPMTLLTMSIQGGTDAKGEWILQTGEVPCGSGVGTIDSYEVYRAQSPLGPWQMVTSGDSMTLEFIDPSVCLDTALYYYRVISKKNGVSEPVPEEPQPPQQPE